MRAVLRNTDILSHTDVQQTGTHHGYHIVYAALYACSTAYTAIYLMSSFEILSEVGTTQKHLGTSLWIVYERYSTAYFVASDLIHSYIFIVQGDIVKFLSCKSASFQREVALNYGPVVRLYGLLRVIGVGTFPTSDAKMSLHTETNNVHIRSNSFTQYPHQGREYFSRVQSLHGVRIVTHLSSTETI